MGPFTRKSKWDELREVAFAAVKDPSARQAGKVTLTVVGGAVAATIASAAVSAARQGDKS
jgi:hypothetical protein